LWVVLEVSMNLPDGVMWSLQSKNRADVETSEDI
jgi:hypothetical protein